MQLQRSSPQKPAQLSLELRFSSHNHFWYDPALYIGGNIIIGRGWLI
jgi:hypothetical protein